MQNTTNMYCALLYNAIMYNCEDIVTIRDLNFRYLFVNKSFLKLFSLQNESNVLNKKIDDFLGSTVCQVITRNTLDIIKTNEPKSFIFHVNENDNTKFLKITSFPIIQDKKIIAILSFTKDETLEEGLKQKLVEKVCAINSLLDNMPILVYMNDKEKNYIAGSRHAKKFFQEGIDAYSGNIHINMKDALSIISLEDDYVINNKAVTISEKSCKSTDEQEHWYKIYKAPIFDFNNEVNGFVTIAQNIDSEKQLELQKELFVATLSHDLKTPLQAQISSLELISKGKFGTVNKAQKEILDMIIESTTFMREMLYSILSIYKYENGMVKLNKKFFNIKNLIQLCIKEASHLAQEKNISFEFCNNIKEEMIFADESQIRRVIANILNNGINYAFKNTKLSVVICENDEYKIIKIKTISTPIAEDIRKQIFNKYVSETDLSKKRGIGLGLYFCKMVVDAHKGKISINAYDTNNEFVLQLPKIKIDNDFLKFM